MRYRAAAAAFSLIFLGASPPSRAASADDTCRLLGSRLASVKSEDCRRAGLQAGPTASVKGRALLWRDFVPPQGQAPERRILLVGGVHGDEFSSISIVFKWMQKLEEGVGQQFHWRVMPCLNPDGLLRRPATRMNANGVDLNRNFPSPDWEGRARDYWLHRTRQDPRRFPGTTPASEPEVRLLVEEIQRFRPDVIVSIHAPFGVLDYDGPHQPPHKIGYLHLHRLGTFPGSLGEYAGQFLGVPVVTLELPHAGILPSAAQTRRIFADLVSWIEAGLPERPEAAALEAESASPAVAQP